MRQAALPFAVVLCLCTGCLSAARKVEQAIRRGADERESPARKTVSEDELPQVSLRPVRVAPGHPRLFVQNAAGDRKWPIADSRVAQDWQKLLIERADRFSQQPPVTYSEKLLTRSREALRRISLFAGVYRFTGDRKYADAGRRELLAVCRFENWQPDDFLATSEMMTAASIGYDWLYDVLSPGERKTVIAAIASNGLRPALDAYESRGGWTRAQHNWNLVCNGSVIVASLAIAEEDPALTRKTLTHALSSIRYGLSAYDPFGGTAEGPMYHSYASRYLTFAAAAMRSAAGDDRLANEDATTPRPWLKAARYRLAMTSPSGLVANFGDGGASLGNTAWALWIAGQQADDVVTTFQAAVDRDDPSVFDLLWYRPAPASPAARKRTSPPVATAAKFGSAVVLRSDEHEQFLALRTGSTADHHSHLDLGNFVLDMNGERFAADLGADNYALPGYLGPRRADYLRSSTPGHNTLTIGETSQPLSAEARVTSGPNDKSVTIDLSDAYPAARSVVRTASLDGRVVTIQDDLRAKRATPFVWHLHTPAKVTLTKTGAILESRGKRVLLQIIEPAGGRFTAEPDRTTPPELPVDGMTHLRLKVDVDKEATIKVRFRPE